MKKRISLILLCMLSLMILCSCIEKTTQVENGINKVPAIEVFPKSGSYTQIQEVSLSNSLSGAMIYYTIDGSEPTEYSFRYYEPILVTQSMNLKAIAIYPGYQRSESINETYTINVNLPQDFVYVQGGSFIMGDNYGNSISYFHEVQVASFMISKYELSQNDWQMIMGSNPSVNQSDTNKPVENVSFYDAMVYCNKRSIQEGLDPCYSLNGSTSPDQWGAIPINFNEEWDRIQCNWSANGYRLPSEAEWEYAARGGIYTHGYIYSGSFSLEMVGWYNQNSNDTIQLPAQLAANELGLFDMSGNVNEWCWDWHDSYPLTKVYYPVGPLFGSCRVYRGGDIYQNLYHCMVGSRFNDYPNMKSNRTGLRLARNFRTTMDIKAK